MRELVHTADGNLGLNFVSEMIPACRTPLDRPLAQTRGDVSGDRQ